MKTSFITTCLKDNVETSLCPRVILCYSYCKLHRTDRLFISRVQSLTSLERRLKLDPKNSMLMTGSLIGCDLRAKILNLVRAHWNVL